MKYLLCHNDVEDYTKWRKLFDADAEAHMKSGLTLRNFWRELEKPNTVFFLFEVKDQDKAKAFLNAPDAKEHAKQSGVMKGDFHFVEDQELY